MSYENPPCGPRERLRQIIFLENAISEDKMSLRTSALAHFIQNKLFYNIFSLFYCNNIFYHFLGYFGQKAYRCKTVLNMFEDSAY